MSAVAEIDVTDETKWPSLHELGEKLLRARCHLMTKEPWYGHIAMGIEWKRSDFPWVQGKSKTMGVRINRRGVVECLWYPGFIHSQSVKQLYATIYHEIDHIVRLHCIRIGSNREPEAWNIAADMTINGRKESPRIGYRETDTGKIHLPLDGNLVWIPEGWEDNQTTEFYYNKLVKSGPAMPCPKCMKAGKTAPEGTPEGNGSDPGKCPTCGGGCGGGQEGKYSWAGVSGDQLDDHSTWQQSEVSQDEARQIVKDMVREATSRNRGLTPGHLTSAIDELNKPVVRWREKLKSYIGTHVGSRRMTYSRRHRRQDAFGLKGISHHAASKVRVIVDTSGSVSQKELQQFFAEIDQLAAYAEVKVLQWDHDMQGYDKYRRGDWKKWKINGRGGTNMADPIYWLENNKQLGNCQILLTDGECNWAEPRSWYPDLGMISVITRVEPVGPSWGHVVRVTV